MAIFSQQDAKLALCLIGAEYRTADGMRSVVAMWSTLSQPGATIAMMSARLVIDSGMRSPLPRQT